MRYKAVRYEAEPRNEAVVRSLPSPRCQYRFYSNNLYNPSSSDFFVEKQLTKHQLAFAQPASPTKWLRRMTLDLTGLPPTLAELDAFEKDVALNGEAAFVAAVDRVLSSPHYGERLALDWLDVARYADTNGFQFDSR